MRPTTPEELHEAVIEDCAERSLRLARWGMPLNRRPIAEVMEEHRNVAYVVAICGVPESVKLARVVAITARPGDFRGSGHVARVRPPLSEDVVMLYQKVIRQLDKLFTETQATCQAAGIVWPLADRLPSIQVERNKKMLASPLQGE